MKRKATPVKNNTTSDTSMNLKEIESLIKFVQNSGVAEVSLEQKDFKITIKATHESSVVSHIPQFVHAPAPMHHAPAQVASAPVKESGNPSIDESKYITIKSPMIGTFYRYVFRFINRRISTFFYRCCSKVCRRMVQRSRCMNKLWYMTNYG